MVGFVWYFGESCEWADWLTISSLADLTFSCSKSSEGKDGSEGELHVECFGWSEVKSDGLLEMNGQLLVEMHKTQELLDAR